jgi:hypothetical protein
MDRWLHEILDIIIWGRSYWWLHKEIDKEAKALGKYHRIYDSHDWYRKFKKSWDWENPFPKKELSKEIPEILKVIPTEFRQTFNKLVNREMRLSKDKGLVKEAFQAYIIHCFFDRMWAESLPEEKEYIKRFCVVWILSPRLLFDKAGVDIEKWKIKVKRDGEVWEDSPGLETNYKNLVKFLTSEGIVERLVGTKTNDG